MMIDDPIVEEIRQHRQAHAAQYGNDLRKICEALRQEEKNAAFKVVYRNANPPSAKLSQPNQTTINAIKELEAGHMHTASNVEELFSDLYRDMSASNK